jgi:hypothetical protein
MMERLYVKNFLGLKEIELEIKDFLILTGPQAAGKSICAKLLYFFRTFIIVMIDCIFEKDNNVSDLPIDMSGQFCKYFPKEYWESYEFFIEYNNFSDKITLTKTKNSELQIELSNWPSQKLIDKVKMHTLFKDPISPDTNIKNIINDFIQTNFSHTFSYSNIFIPAGRSFFSMLQKNIFSILSGNNEIDPFMKVFGIYFESIRKQKQNDFGSQEILLESINALTNKIIKGKYLPEENSILLNNNTKVNVAVSSSGQQEALPLVAILSSIPFNFQGIGVNVYVEEPEAHLFPEAQEQLASLISLVKYNSIQKTNFIITTHSPYMLSAFNNLLLAGNISKTGTDEQKESVSQIIPENMQIDIGNFSAYLLEDGKQKNIIDAENKLINAEAIDGVSENIGETFSKLLDIGFQR